MLREDDTSGGVEVHVPQLVVAALVSIGLSVLAATVITAVIFIAAVLLLRPHAPKPDPTQRSIKEPTPPRIYVLGQRRVFGSSMLFVNGTSRSAVDVWAFCEGPANAVTGVFLNDDAATIIGGYVQALPDGAYAGSLVKAGYNLGAATETAHAAVVAETPEWTSDHRGDGIVSGYLIKFPASSKKFLDVYPQGDNVQMSLVVEGLACFDPRDEAQDPDDPSTWLYTENPVLQHLWFYMVYRGYSYAERLEPVIGMWNDAADICDEAVDLSAGGTEPRYRGAIVFSGEMQPSDIESEIRAAYDGWTAEDAHGRVRVYAGKLYTPTLTLTENDVIDYQIGHNVITEDRINEIIVRTISADHNYNEVECDPWRDEDDILENGLNNTTLDLQVPSYTQGRRLAKRTMAKINSQNKGTVKVKRSGMAALGERYVHLTIAEAGTTIIDADVEIIGGERDYETGGMSLDFLSVDENVDAWNEETEDGDPAPTAEKPYLPPLEAPEIDSATAVTDISGTRVEIVAVDPGVAADEWFTRWRVVGSSSWVEETQTSEDLTFLTGIVPYDAMVEVEIAYGLGGSISPWSDPETVDTTLPS